MPYDLSDKASTYMRRQDRGVEDEGWIRTFLNLNPVGVLATLHEGQPFVNTNIYVYDEQENAIYFHTARVGRTRWNIERDERVCFSASEVGRILPDATALQFSVEYASVVVFGRGSVVDDDDEKRRALDLVMRKYAPHLEAGEDYGPTTQSDLDRTSVYRVEIDKWSGKRKIVELDFPGAFEYEEKTAWSRDFRVNAGA